VIQVVETIERFLGGCLDPVLCEPGEEWLAITPENFVLEARGECAQLQAWDQRRNLVRRVTGIESQSRGKLVLKVARFGKVPGTLQLIDRQKAERDNVPLHSARLGFREQFRRFLSRQFPSCKLAELTTEADLEHTLSPAYPRALLRQGASAWAAIGAASDTSHPDGVLTFGLIWLDYLRRREPSLMVQGLVLYLPAGRAKTTCLRLLFLDPAVARYRAFMFDDEGIEEPVDLRDYGNLDTYLEPQRGLGERLSYRVNGLECSDKKRADQLSRFRCADALDRRNPLYLRNPEAWLESQVRSHIQEIDAGLLPAPVYGQVPAFAAADRGVLDLLAVDRRGRLAVIELKASEDVHLPLQALDYWMRVQWHVERREFQAQGYFPAQELINESPRLLLVSPVLDIHPSNEQVLRYLSPRIPVERIGVGLEWRKELKVMYRS
jgi:hypothetical protein